MKEVKGIHRFMYFYKPDSLFETSLTPTLFIIGDFWLLDQMENRTFLKE